VWKLSVKKKKEKKKLLKKKKKHPTPHVSNEQSKSYTTAQAGWTTKFDDTKMKMQNNVVLIKQF